MPRTAANDHLTDLVLTGESGPELVTTTPSQVTDDPPQVKDAAPPAAGENAPVARPTELFWVGPMTPDGRPAEFFGGGVDMEPIPPRDLTADEVAALSDAQWAAIESTNGQRLYTAMKPETAS